MSFYLLLSICLEILILNVQVLCQGCFPEQSKCRYKSEGEIIKYYSKGIIPSSQKEYNSTFLNCVFGYYKCGYMIKNYGEAFYNSSGVHIGTGIDLSYLNEEMMKKLDFSDDLKKKIKNYINLRGEEAENYLSNYPLYLDEEEVNTINEKMFYNASSWLHNKYSGQNIFPSMSTELTIIAFHMKYSNHTDLMKKVEVFIKQRQWSDLSYYFLTFLPGDYKERKILSSCLVYPSKPSSDRHHIGILLDSKIKESEREKWKSLLNYLMSFIGNDDNSMIPKEKKLFTIGNSFTIDFEKKTCGEALDYMSKYEYIYDDDENLQKAIDEMLKSMLTNEDDLFDNLYYQKVLVVFLTNNPKETRLSFAEYKKKGINVIIVGNREKITFEILLEDFEDKYNIIPFYEFDDFDNKASDFIQILENAISTQVEEFNFQVLSNEHPTKKSIKQVQTYRENSFNYFKIKKYKSDTPYHIEINYNNKNQIPPNISMFISKDLPYPDVINHTVKHFGLGIEKPYMNVLSRYKGDSFTIAIFGQNLDYSITIEECTKEIEDKCKDDSNGIFGKENATIQNNEYAAFNNCNYLYCPYSKEELINKYFSEIGNKVTHIVNQDSFYFSWEVFHCLYEIKTCAYFKVKDGEINVEEGVYAANLRLNQLEEIDLLTTNYPFHIVNRLYPFLNKKYNPKTILTTYNNYNLDFSLQEIEGFYMHDIVFQMRYLVQNLKKCRLREFDQMEKFGLLLRGYSKNSSLENEIRLLCQGEIDEFIDKYIMPDYLSGNEQKKLQAEFQMMLFRSSEMVVPDQIMVSVILGKPLLKEKNLSFIIKKLLQKKLAISYFDAENNKTVLLTDGFVDCIEDSILKINETKVTKIEVIDITNMLKQQINLFNNYDYGVKKVIVFISMVDEYEVGKIDAKIMQMITDMGINFIHFTNNNTYIGQFQEEKVIYFSDIDNETDSLLKIINKIQIPITKKEKMVFDLKQNEIITFAFNYSIDEEKHDDPDSNKFESNIVNFFFDNNNISVYFSEMYPFPNKYIHDKIGVNNDTEGHKINYTYPLSKKVNTFYMSVEAKDDDVSYLTVNIEECKGNCKKDTNMIIILVSFLVGGGIILIYGIYNCFCDSVVKREKNIFER